jgi:hypothetical protein
MQHLVHAGDHGNFVRLSFGNLLNVKSLHFLAAGKT